MNEDEYSIGCGCDTLIIIALLLYIAKLIKGAWLWQ